MEDIHDIAEPLSLIFNYQPIIIFFAILLLIIAILLYLSLRKKPEPPVTESVTVIKLLPRDIALQELEKIKKDKLIETDKSEVFYNRLTLILKNYLTEQYQLETAAKTTTEIILQVKTMKLGYDFVRHLETCLKDYDFAKYSSYKASQKDMNESMELAFSLFKIENGMTK